MAKRTKTTKAEKPIADPAKDDAAKAAAEDTAANDGRQSQEASTSPALSEAEIARAKFQEVFVIVNGPGAKTSDAAAQQELYVALGCELLPDALAIAVFDAAIKQGDKATRHLLAAAGFAVEEKDGVLTLAKETKELIATTPELDLVEAFLAWRLKRFAHTANAATKMQEWGLHILQLHSFLVTTKL